MHAISRWLKLDDASGFVALSGLAGVWSLLAAGLLADGTYGAGWNGIGVAEYLGVSGQGITGLFAAATGATPCSGTRATTSVTARPEPM